MDFLLVRIQELRRPLFACEVDSRSNSAYFFSTFLRQDERNVIAKLALENGTVFTGEAFGAPGEISGEVVFNTSLTGYQEILTDPSYAGQIVTMTYPLIGNYGVN